MLKTCLSLNFREQNQGQRSRRFFWEIISGSKREGVGRVRQGMKNGVYLTDLVTADSWVSIPQSPSEEPCASELSLWRRQGPLSTRLPPPLVTISVFNRHFHKVLKFTSLICMRNQWWLNCLVKLSSKSTYMDQLYNYRYLQICWSPLVLNSFRCIWSVSPNSTRKSLT